MSKNKNKYSTCVVVDSKGRVICYLSSKDEEMGLDIRYDLMGYKVNAL